MPRFTKIFNGYSITLSDIDILPNYDIPLPTINEILQESINCNSVYSSNLELACSIDPQKWYDVFNECYDDDCFLNRKNPTGNKYRNKYITDILTVIKDGYHIVELEPGCLLGDLEIIHSLKNKNITHLTITHDRPALDLVDIISETIDKNNTFEFPYHLISPLYNNRRLNWGMMNIMRIVRLLGYAKYVGINLTIEVVNSCKDTNCNLYIAMDYYDENIRNVIDLHSKLLLLSERIPEFRVILCRTDGLFSRDIIYTNFVLNPVTKTPKMLQIIENLNNKEYQTSNNELLDVFKDYEEHSGLFTEEFVTMAMNMAMSFFSQLSKQSREPPIS